MSSHVCKHQEIIPQAIRETISMRYHVVTRAINREFWGIDSELEHSLYVGSYGRGTAVNTSDLDILVELPQNRYMQYDVVKGNGQSRLLQAVRLAILNTYPRSDVRADGQVVIISFSDGMKFEILPAFKNLNWIGQWDGAYIYPDTNMGGNWLPTNPKAEQEAMYAKNRQSNGLLYDTCKHIRSVRDSNYKSYHLSGIVIDSFVFSTIGSWKWVPDGETSTSAWGEYENHLLKSLENYLQRGIYHLYAPGSNQVLSWRDSTECLWKVLNYMVN